MKKILFLISGFVFLSGVLVSFHGCIDPYHPEINPEDTKPVLVVEGQITDQTGPFKVRLTKAVSVYTDPNLLDQNNPVSGANVHIVDNEGHDYMLEETFNGWYQTLESNLAGKPGNSYILNITTADGMQYESSSQTMMSPPDIDSVYFEESERLRFEQEKAINETWLDILVDSKIPAEDVNYLRWECEETWEFHMPARILVDHGPPSPVNGSYEPPSWETVKIDDTNEKICWITEQTRKILVASTVGYKDRKVNHFVLQSIGPPGDKLNIRYSILVKQYTMNSELYHILKKLRDANLESAGLYSKNPGQIFGNISCCNTGEKVLGYFMASAVRSKRIFINRFDVHIDTGTGFEGCGWTTAPPLHVRLFLYGRYNNRQVWSDNRYCVDCTVRGTKVRPDFW